MAIAKPSRTAQHIVLAAITPEMAGTYATPSRVSRSDMYRLGRKVGLKPDTAPMTSD
jgi:hypothetical protein